MDKKGSSVIGCIVIVFLLSVSLPTVLAGTSVIASTNSKFYSDTADLKVLRLITKYEVITPDLRFETSAKATTVVNNSGPALIEERYIGWVEMNGASVRAGGMISNACSASSATKVTSNLSSEVEVKGGANVVHTSVAGMALANILKEQVEYELGLSGAHLVQTNSVAPGVGTHPEFEKIKITFEAFPTESEIPADINQTVNVVYNIEDGTLKGYGYDFFNEVTANDITCTSSMSYKKVGGGDG